MEGGNGSRGLDTQHVPGRANATLNPDPHVGRLVDLHDTRHGQQAPERSSRCGGGLGTGDGDGRSAALRGVSQPDGGVLAAVAYQLDKSTRAHDDGVAGHGAGYGNRTASVGNCPVNRTEANESPRRHRLEKNPLGDGTVTGPEERNVRRSVGRVGAYGAFGRKRGWRARRRRWASGAAWLAILFTGELGATSPEGGSKRDHKDDLFHAG